MTARRTLGAGVILAPSKVPRVGMIGERSGSDNFLAAFRQGLRDLGPERR